MTDPILRFVDIVLPGLNGAPMTFDVGSHRATIVLGPEDSGINALGSYALGLARPVAGRALLFGDDVGLLPHRAALALRRRVGYLPAGDGLLHNLSLRDNIALPLRFGSDMPDRDIDGRIRIMLSLLRLAPVAELRPAAVGEEQRRRAALARALAFDPDLVILEDPFDGLTARTAAELLELARGGETDTGSRRTLFMTSQYLPSLLEPRIEVQHRLDRGELVSSQ